MRPERPYRALRAGVGTAVLLGLTALWAAGKLGYGAELDAMWDVVMIAIVVAAGYAVYGPGTMGQAMDDAQGLTDSEGATVVETPHEDPRKDTEGEA